MVIRNLISIIGTRILLINPSLNIRGLSAGWVDKEVRTIIPAVATAELDIRLVPESDADHLIKLVRAYISSQGYHFVKNIPSEEERARYDKLISFQAVYSYAAFRNGLNLVHSRRL